MVDASSAVYDLINEPEIIMVCWSCMRDACCHGIGFFRCPCCNGTRGQSQMADPNQSSVTRHYLRGVFALALFSVATMFNVNSVHSESLEHAWANGIVSEPRLKVESKTANGTQELFSYFTGIKARRGIFWLDEGPSTVTSSTVLPATANELVWGGRVTATMPLFAMDHLFSDAGQEMDVRKELRARDRLETLDLKLVVADAFVRVLRSRRAGLIAIESIADFTAQLHTMSNLFGNAWVDSDDLEAGRSALSQARLRETETRSEIDIADRNFNRILNRPLSVPVSLEELPSPVPADGLHLLICRAFKNRPELVPIMNLAAVVRRETRIVHLAALPTIGISVGYNHFENSAFPRDHVWTIGLVGTWNIFESSRARHNIRMVKDKADAVSRLVPDAMYRISREVRQAWFGTVETHNQLEIAANVASEAEENLKVARADCVAGRGSNIKVLEAVALRHRCSEMSAAAFYDAVMADFKLRRAVGVL